MVLTTGFSKAVTVTTTFDNLSANNNGNNGIGNLYQSGDFKFNNSGLFFRGKTSIYYPGSGAIYSTSSTIITITRASGQAFNFYAADVAERDNTAGSVGFIGTRADGSKVTSTVSLDGNYPASQTFGFAGFTNIVSLQFTGGDQLDKVIFSDLVPPPASDANVHFDNASLGPVTGIYGESGYLFSTTASGGLAIQSTMNDSQGIGVAGAGTIDLTNVGSLFSLKGFDIQGTAGITGLFRLIVTDETGTQRTSSNLSYGTYNEAALLQMFGGQALANQITNARFENTTGQGIVLDNIYAVPEPSALLLALGGLALALRRTGPSIPLSPYQNLQSKPHQQP